MTEYLHIAPDFRHLMELNDKERMDSLYEPFWIGYPKANSLFQYLDSLLNRPKRDRVQSAILIAESNMGKTTLIRHFADINPPTEVKDSEGITRPNIPILITEAPPSANERGFHSSILDAFKCSYRPTDTVAKLEHQAMHLLKECNVRMLIIDEFHNLNAGTVAKLETILNIIKSMSNTLSIPIVAVGIKEAELIINRDPQIRSRFDRLRLMKWKNKKEISGLLRQFESRLPLKKPSDLGKKTNQELQNLLISISKGNIGALHKLLIACSLEAIESGEEQITLEIVNKFEGFTKTYKHGGEIRELEF